MSTDASPDAVQAAQSAMARARAAQIGWAALTVGERVAKLRAANLHVLQHAEEIAAIIVAETRKPLAEAYSSEVLGIGDLFAYWCKHGPSQLAPRTGLIPALEMPGKKAQVHRVPRGVVACISPWNYPVSLPMRTIVPALLGGNAVVLKPSEVTPRSGMWMVAKLQEVLGDVIVGLDGDGAAGAALVQALPDLVVFTGSTATGRKVAVACAQLGIECALELGGKDCAVVLADAELERTAKGVAWGILTNAGQNCSGIERVAVHSAVAAAFLPKLVQALQVAAPDVPELVTAQQRAIVVRHIADAVGRGAKVLTGGVPADGKATAPTLLSDVPADAPAWCDESFGPLAVVAVGNDDAALIRLANDSRYGLGASVWSANVDHAQTVASQVRSGMVWINNHSFSGALPDLPWTGVGDSGTGVTNSPDALHHMTRPRLVVVDRNKQAEPWWYPYGDHMVALMRVLVARQQSNGIGATLRTLGALKRRMAEMTTDRK